MPEFVNPIEVLNQLQLRSTMVAVDFGCGSGGWTIPLAKRLEHGKVFAVDIQEESLSALESKAKFQNVNNIKKILANVEGKVSELKNSFFDLVLMTDLLFEIDEKESVFQEAHRILKPGGEVLVVDWNVNSSLGPKDEKVSPDELKEVAQKTGFKFDKQFKAGDYHYGLVFIKEI